MPRTIRFEDFLFKQCYHDDIQELCEMIGVKKTGNIPELIDNLIEGIMDEDSYDDVLGPEEMKDSIWGWMEGMFDKDGWKDIADDYDVHYTSKTKKGDIVDAVSEIVVLPIPKGRPRQIRREEKSAPKKSASSSSTLASLVSEIEEWIPKKRHTNEEGYQVDLDGYLNYECGHKVRMEVGASRADIVVDDNIAIEMKKNPTQPGYDRCFGQISRHNRQYGKVIIVICDVKRKQMFDDFIDEVENAYSGENVVVLKK